MQTITKYIAIILGFITVIVWMHHAWGVEKFVSQSLDCEAPDKPYSMLFFGLNDDAKSFAFEKEWVKFKSSAPGQGWFDKVCLANFTSDGSMRDADAAAKYNVKAYPTVLWVENTTGNVPAVYNGDATAEALNAYAANNAVEVLGKTPESFDPVRTTPVSTGAYTNAP